MGVGDGVMWATEQKGRDESRPYVTTAHGDAGDKPREAHLFPRYETAAHCPLPTDY